VSLPRERLLRATAVIRDLTRTSMAATAKLEEPPAARAALHERAHELEDELRGEPRAPHRAVATDESDVLAVLRATGIVRQLRSIGQACIRALPALEVLAGAHV
jgi:predicted deacylase